MKKKTLIIPDVLIENYAAEGKSLARVNGKVFFVERTVPGDVVDVQLYKNRKDWAEGFPVSFHKFSDIRVQPFCQHFGVCGGCQWQMLPYNKQLEYKQQQVTDNLSRIGKVPLPEILPIIPAAETRYYRNKLEYSFSRKQYIAEAVYRKMRAQNIDVKKESEKNVAGFYAKGVFDKVVNIEKCHLQIEPTNAIRNTIAEYARAKQFSFYDFREHAGWLRNMQIRIATTGELMVNIILGYEDETSRTELLNFTLKSFPEITTLLYTINTKNNDSIYDLTPQIYFGKGYIIETLEDFKFKISPKSFFQTNTKQAEALYKIVRSFAESLKSEVIYDLYCGTGSIGIFISKLAKKIIGVEEIEEAVNDAKENAALNNIAHAKFFTGDVIKVCNHEFFELNGKPDIIITDPPRIGMHEKMVRKLVEIQSPGIIYVSCNPATQARDISLLADYYSVEKIQPVDMFPHTHHIENVVLLKLKEEE